MLLNAVRLTDGEISESVERSVTENTTPIMLLGNYGEDTYRPLVAEYRLWADEDLDD